MSRAFTGLDNPSFQGNLRTYRRRYVTGVNPRAALPVVLLDDVKESDLSVQVVLPQAKPPSKIESPLHQPSNLSTYQAGAEIVRTTPVKEAKHYRSWSPRQITPVLKDKQEAQLPTQLIEIPEEASSEPSEKKQSKLSFMKFSFLKKITKQNILSLRFALPSMAAVIFLLGCGVALQGVLTNRKVEAQVQELSSAPVQDGETGVSGTSEVPDETEPDKKTYGAYKVAPDAPKYVRIKKIGVNSRVIRVGVKANNELKAPSNIFDAGWYENSAKPGETGAMLLDGHVHGPTRPGVFFKLKNLVVGDEIELERGDGVRLKYRIEETETKGYQEVDMNKAMRSHDPAKPGLNIITCTGKYNTQLKQYEQRQLVYAVQM